MSELEIEAILDVVPHSCRANASWAVPLLVTTARQGGMSHPRHIAYLLATAHHLSRFGAKLTETSPARSASGTQTSINCYEPGTAQGSALGNIEPGDGARFRGRGFFYIKGRASYAAWSRRLGLPDHELGEGAVPFLVAEPEALAQRELAARTLVQGMRDGLFTGAALGQYVNDRKTDYLNARHVVNVTAQARDVAELALGYQAVIERIAGERHGTALRQQATLSLSDNALQVVRDAVERLAARGAMMMEPIDVRDWDGKPRQGKFVQLDERTCALHLGRGTYVRLDVQRDLNGIVPPEATNVILKRTGDVRPALRGGAAEVWH